MNSRQQLSPELFRSCDFVRAVAASESDSEPEPDSDASVNAGSLPPVDCKTLLRYVPFRVTTKQLQGLHEFVTTGVIPWNTATLHLGNFLQVRGLAEAVLDHLQVFGDIKQRGNMVIRSGLLQPSVLASVLEAPKRHAPFRTKTHAVEPFLNTLHTMREAYGCQDMPGVLPVYRMMFPKIGADGTATKPWVHLCVWAYVGNMRLLKPLLIGAPVMDLAYASKFAAAGNQVGVLEAFAAVASPLLFTSHQTLRYAIQHLSLGAMQWCVTHGVPTAHLVGAALNISRCDLMRTHPAAVVYAIQQLKMTPPLHAVVLFLEWGDVATATAVVNGLLACQHTDVAVLVEVVLMHWPNASLPHIMDAFTGVMRHSENYWVFRLWAVVGRLTSKDSMPQNVVTNALHNLIWCLRHCKNCQRFSGSMAPFLAQHAFVREFVLTSFRTTLQRAIPACWENHDVVRVVLFLASQPGAQDDASDFTHALRSLSWCHESLLLWCIHDGDLTPAAETSLRWAMAQDDPELTAVFTPQVLAKATCVAIATYERDRDKPREDWFRFFIGLPVEFGYTLTHSRPQRLQKLIPSLHSSMPSPLKRLVLDRMARECQHRIKARQGHLREQQRQRGRKRRRPSVPS